MEDKKSMELRYEITNQKLERKDTNLTLQMPQGTVQYSPNP